MSEPVSFDQVHADGFTTGPHPFTARSPDIIRRNLHRADLPEPIVKVRLRMDDGSLVTMRRRTAA